MRKRAEGMKKGNMRKTWMKSSEKDEKASKSEENEQRIRTTAKGNKRHRRIQERIRKSESERVNRIGKVPAVFR